VTSLRPLKLGTRGSALAITQSQWIADQLAGVGVTCELVLLRTEGDVNRGPLATIGGTGVFVTAVRDALLSGAVDIAVHSYKDLPTASAAGILLAAVPIREDPSDALCARNGWTLDDLPTGAVVGTGSPRRRAQLLVLRPDLDVRAIRGNVDTRLGLVSSGKLDAVVLARAGLSRLGRTAEITGSLGADRMLPAPAQGALAVECRAADDRVARQLAVLDHAPTRAAVLAERRFLTVLEAGCSAPVAALGTVLGSALTLRGAVLALDGSRTLTASISGPLAHADTLGTDLAETLLSQGAADLMRP
jgi:hydroxymethylbilane synthase